MKHKPREYTSASEINALIDNPSAWLLSYKYGYKSAASAAMQRGLDVEYCLVEAIKGNNDFDYESILCDVGIHMFKSGLNPILELAGNATFPNDAKQWKVLYYPDEETNLPIIGYLDLYVPGNELDKPHIIDIKTTSRAPSVFPNMHARQAAAYQLAFTRTYEELWDAGEGMPMLQGQFSDENIPDVTFIYLCSRKTNPVVVFTTATDLRLSKVKPEFVQTIDLGEACEELLAGYEIINHHNNLPISKLRRYIPINTDHYRFSGYDDEILTQFRLGTLEPYNSEL